MIESRRAGLLAAVLVSVALTVIACGGTAATAPGDVTPTPTPTPAGDATPTPSPTPAGDATPGDAIPTFDLSALTGGLPGVDSYRTSTSVGGVPQYETVVVKQPVLSKLITVYDGGEVTTRFVVIGDEVWKADGPDGAFVADTTGMVSAMLMVYDPALMLGAYSGVDWGQAAANLGTEDKNGIQAHHVRIDSTTLFGAAAQMPAGSAIDIWVADAGYLVAWEMSGFPEDANFSIEVTGVNDPANKVERPS